MDLRIKRHFLKGVVLLPVLAVFLFSCITIAGAKDMKIGYINSQRIIDESIAGKEVTKNLELFKNENNMRMEQQGKEIDELENELRKKEFAITPEKKKEIEAQILQKTRELKSFQDTKEKELKEIYFKSFKNIENQVLDIVQKLGQEEGYDLILGRDESGILYANPKNDITEKVIRAFDEKIQK